MARDKISATKIREMTIKELKDFYAQKKPEAEEIELLTADHRKGVQRLASRLKRKLKEEKKLQQQWESKEAYCNKLRSRGYERICGIDEAGRGPLAGPVAAGAVILPPDCYIPGLDDSKKISASRRQELAEEIKAKALAWEVQLIPNTKIDEINILRAASLAMEKALTGLNSEPDYLLVDGEMTINSSIPQEKVIDGDARINVIAAASILAKVTRDALMVKYHDQYPHYNFASNKGYGTAEHIAALEKHGPSPLHRQSFQVVADNAVNGQS